jgi:acetyltransferase-like isoleucine patch superfamily enzyme
MNISNILKFASKISLKTIYFNFKYLPLKQAIKLPFFISKNVLLKKCEGRIEILGSLKPAMVKIGYNKIGIFDGSRSKSIWEVSGNVIFEGKCDIGQGTKISVFKDASLSFGQDFKISAETSIICSNNIKFGQNCLLSWDILIMDSDMHIIVDMEDNQINYPQSIYLGDNVWVGCRTTILKGTSIPSNSVIAATSLVTGKMNKENCVYGDQPLRILKTNISWRL